MLFRSNKSVVYSPSPSNTVRSGDVLTYQVAISSSGSDIAAGVILTDLIPTHTTYISGSAAILLGANAGPQTDVPGDDEFELLGTGLVFRLGAGATSTQGGSLALSNTPAISNSTTIQFAVRVSASLTQTTVITNQAEVIYVGSTLTTTQFTATSNNAVVTVTVEATHTMPISLTGANLSLIKTVSPATAINGDWITYTLVVSNAGPQDMPVSSLIKVPSDTVVTLGPADRYPATLNVQGLSALTDISVTLRDVSHGYVADLDVLLVGPQGQSVLLMSDAGGTTSLDHATLSFHTGSPSLPDATQILTGTYGPTDFVGNDGKDVFPAPAPSTHTLNLSSFIGTSPNGEWKLFINDDQADDVGTVAKGWSLTLFTKDGRAVFDQRCRQRASGA